MRHSVFAFALAGLVGGCAPLELFYREGAPVQQMNADLGLCTQKGLRDVPVDQDTRFVPGQEIPQTFCDASGVCQTVWVQVSPDRIETYDANEGRRDTYVHACMAQAGYQPVSLPPCSDAVVRATRLSATKTLPPLASNSCAIRLKTGQYQIVTPPS